MIESRRARNLGKSCRSSSLKLVFTASENTILHPVIAKRRIGHSAEDVRDFILATDLDGLLPEYCELLLKFIPTQEEVSQKKSSTL